MARPQRLTRPSLALGLRSSDTEAVSVLVPATSANLGPGFDAFGLALGWYDRVSAAVVDKPAVTVDVEGEGAGIVPTDERNLVARAALASFEAMGMVAPGLRLTCANRIPHGRGLGSSAAAIVAGVLLGRALATSDPRRPNRVLDDAAVLDLSASLEGHPDNVAAALLGGLTIAWRGEKAPDARAARLDPSPEVVPVVLVPTAQASTEQARRLLPAAVPHDDAAANAARAALLVVALTQRPDLLMVATEDRLHQSYRAPAMPQSAALVERLREDGIPAVISGAGPTVLVLTDPATARAVVTSAPAGWAGRLPGVDLRGARLDPEPTGK